MHEWHERGAMAADGERTQSQWVIGAGPRKLEEEDNCLCFKLTNNFHTIQKYEDKLKFFYLYNNINKKTCLVE